MQFYDITISIFGLSEREGLILDQCAQIINDFLVLLYTHAFHTILLRYGDFQSLLYIDRRINSKLAGGNIVLRFPHMQAEKN